VRRWISFIAGLLFGEDLSDDIYNW
jgi:hypothetical protein